MLHQNANIALRYENESAPNPQNDTIDVERLLGVVRRQWKLVLVFVVAGICLAIAYLWITTPFYRATAELLLDQSQGQISQQLSGFAEPQRAEEAILSQVEMLGSRNVVEMAVNELGLADNIEFLDSGRADLGEVLNSIRRVVGLSVPTSADRPPESRRSLAVSIVQQNVSVQRQGRTYLLSVSFSNPDPVLAADIANALARAYLTDQLNSKYEATRSATEWLESRLEDLRAESLAADLAVQTFRQENGLIAVDGQLVSDQQLAATNVDLVEAQSATSAARASLDRIRQVISSGDPNALVTAALDNPQINNLRQRYVDASARLTSVVERVGPEHEQAQLLQRQIDELQRLMQSELSRIAESYQSDYEIALSNEQSLRDNLATATAASADLNATQVTLRELQSRANSVSALYQSFLQSYQQSAQQASFPMAEARIIAQATIPGRPSSPNTLIALIAGAVLGGMAGSGAAGAREFRDRFIRTAEHLRTDVGVDFLGLAPKLTSRSRSRNLKKEQIAANQVVPLEGTLYVEGIERPTSQFSEALRSAKVAADIALAGQKSKILGMVSLLPEEGKSTISINLAMMLATNGARVLLIDGDIRHPMLSKTLTPYAEAGLPQLILGTATVNDVVHYDSRTGLHVLPIGKVGNIPNASDLLSSPAFGELLGQARSQYDYVVLDLPPITPVVDARAVSHLLDAYVMVVQWGRIPRQFLRNSLRSEPRIADKLLGVVLNKVDMGKLKLYRSSNSSEFYASSYAKYFAD
jgi:polysaccharide biosynthesis transport protein